MPILTSVEELRAIYGELSEASIVKVTPTLTDEYRRLVEIAPFAALATVGPEGLDCSPRGDPGGLVRVADEKTLHLPDWRGNNRIDSLSNIVRDPRVALLFLIPGYNITLRINGAAAISNDEALLKSFEMDGKHPRTVVVITIHEVYFQCARALMRSDLWNPARHIKPEDLPTAGALIKAAKADFDKDSYDREWPGRAAKTLW